MRIDSLLGELLINLVNDMPNGLSAICDYVREHKNFKNILLLLNNSNKSREFLFKTINELTGCIDLYPYTSQLYDLQLAGLLVIANEVQSIIDSTETWMSSFYQKYSTGNRQYYWTSLMATSYFLNQKVNCERLR